MNIILRILKLYKNVPFRYKLYTLIRYAICPFTEIERNIPTEGKILDCGCGHGIFSNLLVMKSAKRHVIGVDIDKGKIDIAVSTIRGRKNVEFKAIDLKDLQEIRDLECITFIDVLHYLNFDEKKELLKNLYNKLKPAGVLVIKSTQEKPYWKYKWTLFYVTTVDKLMHKNFSNSSFFLKRSEFIGLLNEIGFDVEFKKIDRGYMYPHCLYICKKSVIRET